MKIRTANQILHLLRALRFTDTDDSGLRGPIRTSWPDLLKFTDSHYLTIPLALRHRSLFSEEAIERLDRTLERSATCHERVRSAYSRISESLSARGVDFTVLKGFTQWPWYTDNPAHRTQTDIDFHCSPECVDTAKAALEELGYEPVHYRASRDADHLPVMIRKTGWQWKGDYYDPDRPPSVEIHFRFWNAGIEGFASGDSEGFLRRRELRDFSGLLAPALSVRDGLTYTAMHLVRHLLRGDPQMRHVYELAHFLDRSAGDDGFWAAESGRFELVESIAFRLAAGWFGCRLHPSAAAIADALPKRAAKWFDLFEFSPAAGIVRPNKDEIWLHLCLATSPEVRRRLPIRRLLPAVRPRAFADAHSRTPEQSPRLAIRRAAYEARFMLTRALRHLRALPGAAVSALRWWRAGASMSR